MTEKTTPDFVKMLSNGTAEITLSKPATTNGAPTPALRMREPTVGDQEQFQDAVGSEASREISMLANLCEVTPDDIRKLPLRDYGRLQAAFALFTN